MFSTARSKPLITPHVLNVLSLVFEHPRLFLILMSCCSANYFLPMIFCRSTGIYGLELALLDIADLLELAAAELVAVEFLAVLSSSVVAAVLSSM